ncbi:MAG: YfhO family protein [Bacteroidaceae bacterium]|nr:YfhO family protein [Bacteroidaceae bacterium]
MSIHNQPDGNSSLLRRISFLPDLCAVLFFVALSFAYFFHPATEGLVLTGHDHSGGAGAASEMEAYYAAHDYAERTRWTNTLFSGMPTYQMAPSYPSTDRLVKVENVYKLFLPDYVVLVFVMLLGFYILLRAFDFKAWMAALGAVLWAFSSYYFIIIGAGHIWKFYTLAFIPPTLAGMVLCYRGRYAWGLLLTAFFMALQILSNHVQMTYYFGFVIVLMALAFLFEVKSEKFFSWLKSTAVFALGCLIGIAINASNLYHTWEYSKETMRGKSELTGKTKDAADQTRNGLERSYITAWSYGIGETWSLLVPNVKGGASNKGDRFLAMTDSKTAMQKADAMYAPVYQSLSQYWGEQPGTSGPVYVGAFVMFLFVLGLFIVKGPMKWALFAATLLSVTLAWGKNFMPWTDFFLDYVPMYDKFRTVASILVIAEFTIPLLAMMALREIVNAQTLTSGKGAAGAPTGKDLQPAGLSTLPGGVRRWGLAFLLTAGPCLLFWLMPDVFFGSYVSTSEMQMLQDAVRQGYIPQDMLSGLLANLAEMRRAVFTADAGRSLLIILVGCAILLAYSYRKIKTLPMLACVTLLCVADLWDVDKRYLSDEMFSQPQPPAQFFQKTPTDEAILQDSDLYYRVANLAVSTFNDNTTSYWHKSIGGYHAAKLRRYQELIEAYLQPELMALHRAAIESGGRLDSIAGDSLFPVLNMLNTKYVILPLQGGQTVPVSNPWAKGNAWMAGRVVLARNADEEIADLEMLRENPFTAILSPTADRPLADDPSLKPGSGSIRLTAYEANALTFEAESDGGVAVFSDVYYPGWQCTVDGNPTEILRANYVLRAVVLPSGKHTVEFRFDPKSLHTTEAIANAALALLLVLLLLLLTAEIYRRRKLAAE